jgi:O-antigen ligase/tetratricopeptide (TPR) repeat protein
MEVVIFLLAALRLIRAMLFEANAVESRRRLFNLALPAALFVSLVTLQLAPLAPSIEAVVSPSTFQLYQNSLPGWPDRAIDGKFPRPTPHPGGLALLPTSEEVAAGASVPFVQIGQQSGSPPGRRLFVETGSWPLWRSLSIDNTLTEPALLKLVAYLCFFLLIVSHSSGEDDELKLARKLLGAALLAGILTATIALVGRIFPNGKVLWVFTPYDWLRGSPWGSRATGPFANPDHLADYLILVLPIALAGFLMPAAIFRRRRANGQLLCAAAAILAASALLLSASRGGWAGALVGFAVLAGLWPQGEGQHRMPRAAGIAARASLGIFALIVLLVVGPSGRTQADMRLEEAVAQDSVVSRLQNAKVSLAIVRDFPIFGIGLGCWPEVFPRYSAPPWSSIFWNAVHNDYAQLATETGLLGFGLFAWFLGAAFSRIWRAVRLTKPESRVLVAACLAGISAAGVQEFVDFPLQIPANALLLTVLLGVAVHQSEHKSSPPADAGGIRRRLRSGLWLVPIMVLIGAAITQEKVPYPYNLRQLATPTQARFLENAHPANARIHLMQVTALGSRTPADYRMEELRAALWLEPTNSVARDLYVLTLHQAGNKKEALSEMSRSVSNSPTLDTHFYLSPRLISWLLPSEQRAVEAGFRNAVAHRYERALQNFGNYYDILGNFSAEASLFREAAMQKQDRAIRARYFVDAGTAYAKARDFERAQGCFQAATVAVPEDSTAYEQMMLQVFAPRNNIAAAKAALARGVEKGADPFNLYLALASAAQISGNSGEAEAALQNAIAVRPSSSEALVRLGELDLATNKFDRAVDWLERAITVDRSSAAAFYDLGLANEGAYEYFAADRAFRQALALAPANQGFKAHYAMFRQKLTQSKRNDFNP